MRLIKIGGKNMARNIVVSGNCQMAGVSAALKLIFPKDNLIPLAYQHSPALNDSCPLAQILPSADIWFTVSRPWSMQTLENLCITKGIEVITFPNLEFRGFHPDQCYLLKADSPEADPVYYSGIAAWCYKNGIPLDNVATAFDESIFEALGFHSSWNRSVDLMRHLFSNSDLRDDFELYMAHVQRQPIFMHTMNHPHVFAVVHLAKLIAMRIGASRSILNTQIVLPDVLDYCSWPVYPSIANRLALRGSFNFIWGGKAVSLEESLAIIFKHCQANHPDPAGIRFAPHIINHCLMDEVLGNFFEVTV